MVNLEPPSAASLKVTNNYLGTLLVAKNKKEFQQTIEKALEIVNYWLGEDHPEICELLDKLAAYQLDNGDSEAGIALLEQSIKIAENTEAKNPKNIGSRYYVLGKQYLRAGKKKQAY